MDLTFRQLQKEQVPWREYNFPNRDVYYPLLGATEEIGEISHAFLKMKQGIRGTEEQHKEDIADGICDCIIFLADFATAMGIDLQDSMEKTWTMVSKRDWVSFPKNGVSE